MPKRLQAGDPAALRDFVDCFGWRVQRLAHRLCGGHPDAADIAQDVFVVALEKLSTFRGDSPMETWLCGITVRLCRKWVRRQMIQRRLFGWIPGVTAPAECCIDDLSTPTAPHPSEAEFVRRGLQQLSPSDRELLVLRYLEEYSIEDLSSILQCTRATVDQRLHRARVRLGNWINEHA